MTVEYRNPAPTVDIIIEIENDPPSSSPPGIVLIRRNNPPYGWAIPGGFVDYGETLESAAVREAREETGLTVSLVRQFHTYSDPARDPRKHTITTVYVATARGVPAGADDAAEARVFSLDALPEEMAFDHGDILRDYREKKY